MQPGVGPDNRLKSPPFTLFPASGAVSGYSKTTVTAVFAPTVATTSNLRMRVLYKATSQRKLFIQPDYIELEGIGRDVPIFLERSVIDFKCCMYDQVCAVVHNPLWLLQCTCLGKPADNGG